jgi:hypothetical protein
MTTPIQYPLANGNRHGGTVSIELKLAGTIFVGFTSINYTRTRSRTMVYGNSPDPIGKTRGTNEYKADCELYLAEFNAFQALLGPGYGDVFFEINVTYSENGFDTISDTIRGCTLDTTEASNAQGTDPTKRKFELNPTKILFNGIDDMAVPLTGAQTT